MNKGYLKGLFFLILLLGVFFLVVGCVAPLANRPPEKPNNPFPYNGEVDVSITPTLSWNCGDPDGDELTFDIHFGTSTALLPLKESSYTGTSYQPGTLEPNTTYYWQIVARDGKGEITKGDVWSFTTVVPSSTWERTYGGNNDDEALSIQQTVDGGYIVAGYTKSSDAGIDDFYVIKLDPYGARVWEKMYGGSDSERAYSVRQTADGGYIVAGYTKSFGVGEADVYIVKLNNSGEKLWNKTYGGSYNDEAYSIQQTADEGYIVAGFKCSSSDIESADVYILKLDSDGNKVWEKTFGGDKEDIARSVQQTEDGGYIVAGWTNSSGNGEYDVYILKLDSDGNKVWEKTFGGSESDWAYSIQQTVDGGYIVAGYTYTFGTVWYDVYVLKLNSEGNIVWEQTFGDSDYEYAHSVKQTADGGYILAGYVFYPPIKSDVYILKLGSDGNKEWEKTYSGREGSNGGIAYSILQMVDGGYVVAGACEYPSGSGGNEVYILKLNDEGGL